VDAPALGDLSPCPHRIDEGDPLLQHEAPVRYRGLDFGSPERRRANLESGALGSRLRSHLVFSECVEQSSANVCFKLYSVVFSF
jgi:hypothetical protein